MNEWMNEWVSEFICQQHAVETQHITVSFRYKLFVSSVVRQCEHMTFQIVRFLLSAEAKTVLFSAPWRSFFLSRPITAITQEPLHVPGWNLQVAWQLYEPK